MISYVRLHTSSIAELVLFSRRSLMLWVKRLVVIIVHGLSSEDACCYNAIIIFVVVEQAL